MLPSLILTRFLYSKDEVELSLITALLKKDELEIIYYWAYELYYSGFDIFEFMWKIYLDFYYEQQPYFELYFKKKHSMWKLDKDMKHIAYILRNMYNMKASCMVFMFRQYILKEDDTDMYPTIIYKLKNLHIRSEHIRSEHIQGQHLLLTHLLLTHLLLALEKRHFENICYYLKELTKKSHINDICKVIGEFLQVDILENNIHYLLAVIVYKFIENNDETIKKHIYVVPKQQHLDHIKQLEEESIQPIYNTLMAKRFVSIDPSIGSFILARWQWHTHQEFINELWFHWEYYAMGSPLWLMRLEKFGGLVNHLTKKIEFSSEQGEEDFYNLYAYEFDELPKEVQAMSMNPIEKTDGKMWCNYVFQTDNDKDNDKDNDNDLWQWKYM
jgi:hypothetical protein